MGRTVAIGEQNFADIRERGCFLVDKTDFIRRWWESADKVTLICRPRRFGKTLTLSMVEHFFSIAHSGRSDLFEGLSVWDATPLREEQGLWPVIFLSFANIKSQTYEGASLAIRREIARLYERNRNLLDGEILGENERIFFESVRDDMSEPIAVAALNRLCEFLYRKTGKRAIVLLDEYDTPMQEAWLAGYWNQMARFTRELFNNTFKTNPFLERALMTGITCVSRESIFSDLNNLELITTTSDKYSDCFGFTEAEVFAAMDEMGLTDREGVKNWYDGFTFGSSEDIYNPWSIINYLDKGKLRSYWANTSGNELVSALIGSSEIAVKTDFETLLHAGSVKKVIDDHVVFSDLRNSATAIWSLLVASGYLRVSDAMETEESNPVTLTITNKETMRMFDSVVRRWFGSSDGTYGEFVRALLAGDLRAMNRYMNDVALDTFSTFDAANHPAESEPERFYHGFVLGLLVELRGRYEVLSNRESGYGRYDVVLAPLNPEVDDGIVIEFKVLDAYDGERTLDDALASAKRQIAERRYATQLRTRGVPESRIREYGFAFQGKQVLIG